MMASNVLLDSAALVAQGRVSTEPRLGESRLRFAEPPTRGQGLGSLAAIK